MAACAVPGLPEASCAYAKDLYRYASLCLDPYSLRCWLIRRLMLDDGLSHEAAEQVFELVLASVDARRPRLTGGRLRRLPVSRRGTRRTR